MSDKRHIEADDLFRMIQVNDPDVAPDGRTVAYTVTMLDKEDNRYSAAIWTLDLESCTPSRLTSDEHRDGAPRWSPDGSRLAFTSDRNEDEQGKGQLWLMSARGGEAQRLTKLAEPVEDYSWSPDGRSIVAVSKVREIPANPDSDIRHIRTVRFKFDGEGFLDDKYRQIFVIDAETGEARQVTHGAYDHRDPCWSPSGYEIAFAADRAVGWEYRPNRDIYALRVQGGSIRRLSDGTGKWSSPSYSPDGARIVCYGTRRIESDSPRTEIFVLPAGGGAPQSVTEGFDRGFSDGCIADWISFPPRRPLWLDDANVAVVYGDRGSVRLAMVDVDESSVTTLTGDRRRVGAIAPAPDGFVYTGNDAASPGELYMSDRAGGAERKLTGHNDAWLAEVEISVAEPFETPSADGTPVQGWLMKPIGFEEGVRYPAVLEIHGGPFGMYGETFMHEFQLLAAKGYAVVFCNPRGSTGYGDAFAGDLFRAWGINDMPDQMAVVDFAVAQGIADPQRLGVTGGSYGGFMTNWIIGHTDRFKAACTQRCLSDMFSAYGTDDIFFAAGKQTVGGDPWEDPEIYWKLSPISYVGNVSTPLLITHSEEDYRCPIGQAEEMFTALKRLGQEVELVRFPDESHGLSRTGQPTHRIERLQYITGWFDTHL
jgi:dipeptidyl aminopeptidase/acylaminoacyl peptidase